MLGFFRFSRDQWRNTIHFTFSVGLVVVLRERKKGILSFSKRDRVWSFSIEFGASFGGI